MFGIGERRESMGVIEGLRKFRQKVDKASIGWLVKATQQHRPGHKCGMSYDEFVNASRANYEGAQGDRLRRVLQARYSVAGKLMPAVSVNITTEVAELSAQAYRQEPARSLLLDGADPLKPGEEGDGGAQARAKALTAAVKAAKLKIQCPEMERIAELVGCSFGKIRFSQVEGHFGRKERPEVSIFWPSDVRVIPDPAAPGKLFASRVVMLGMGRTDEGARIWEVWTRDQVVDSMDGDGLEVRQGWHFGRFDESGNTLVPMQPYALEDLPIFCISARPSDLIIPDGDRDLIAFQDELNVQNSDHAYKAAWDSHQQVVIKGDARPGQVRAIGPGVVLELPADAELDTIPSDYNNERLDGMQRQLLMMARGKRLSVDAFWTKGGNPETGISREIRNQAADQRRAETVELLEEAEAELLRLLARVVDHWGPDSVTIDGEDAEYLTTFKPPKAFEDQAQKAQRLKTDREDGIISDARYAVEMGHFATEQEAEECGGLSRLPKGAEQEPEAPIVEIQDQIGRLPNVEGENSERRDRVDQTPRD